MAQSSKRIFVVGDTFAGTASQFDNIMTETDALDLVLSSAPLPQPILFLVQQGVDYRSLNSAITEKNAAAQGPAPFALDAGNCGARATRRLAHKARSENILISTPRRISDSKFEMDLCFSSQNEFFLDHMTGMHIQGMALIEAARQAFLAVTEAYFLSGDAKDYYFVIKSMDTSFQNFVFPFDATLNYDVKETRRKDTRLGVEATITISQGGAVCTTIDVAFTAFEAEKIAMREREVAAVCLAELNKSYDANVQDLEEVA